MVSAPTDQKLGVLPSDFLVPLKVEPVNRWFLSYYERLHTARGTSIGQESISGSESDFSEEEEEYEDDIDFLRSLDPKDTKNQDHYKVLGMTNLRFKASDDQIKRAYRQKVLKHHPDKRRGQGEDIREDDDYFTCITRAFETLGTAVKRRAFDSVDPLFDDDIPDQIKEGSKTTDFFSTFKPVFDRNARWSNKRNIPDVGNADSTRQEVDKFYKFWYDFDSWREFSYLDEEEKEKGSDREERRWIEKNNKVQRAEKKKEEMKRIRKLVDNAYNCDPRIANFKEADRQEKLAKKKAKQDAARQRKEAEEKIQRDAEEKARLEKEEQERIEKEKNEKMKNERDALKKALKNERRFLKNTCKGHDYFATDEDSKVQNLTDLDKLCEILNVDELRELNKALEVVDKKTVFINAVHSLNEKLEKEKLELLEKATKGSSASEKTLATKPWSSDELALLIKAVNLFPAGTTNRWEVVASFVNQHSKTPSDSSRTAKETLAKAKQMQQGDYHKSSLKEEVNKNAYENLEKQKKREVKTVDDSEASTRTETAAEAQGLNVSPWSSEEQKLLEQALKTYPASLGAERWDRISECVPDRSKKDCMKRYKELAELIRAKKAAQAAAKAKS